MNKKDIQTHRDIRLAIFQGEPSNIDKGALACDLVVVCIFAWNQIYYEMNMLFLIIPLLFLGMYLILFGMVAEKYHFTSTSLDIRHRFRKTVTIQYPDIFNYEATSKDMFINIAQSNRVKIYYMQANKKKVLICMPKDVASFVETLKWNCPEFYDDTKQKSKLDVFFKNDNRE